MRTPFTSADFAANLQLRFVLACLLLAGAFVATPVAAQNDCTNQGCNSTSITAVLFPDRQATVYVNLRTLCGSTVLKSCQVNFLSPPTLDPRLKCEELVTALSQGDCLDSGYEVTTNRCDVAPPTFVVTDPDFPQSFVEVGITCDPNVFTQTGQGQPICDYEGDVITPGNVLTGETCVSDDTVVTDVTFRGTATGDPIVTSIPSTPHVSVLVGQRDQPPIAVEILTAPGIPDRELAQAFGERLRNLGVSVEPVGDGRTLRLRSEAPGRVVGIGAATDDTGITFATISGQERTILDRFPPPFDSLGDCISTWIAERCSGLRGSARAECNQAQQEECRLLFD